MQAVILAAGRGVRMGSLTSETPKPLLIVAGKTLLEHKLDVLPPIVDEVVIVIGYLGEKIRERLGKRYGRLPIRYVQDKQLGGTAKALAAAKGVLGERFLVLMGDDLYSAKDLEIMTTHNFAIGAFRQTGVCRPAAAIYLNEDQSVKDIVESVSDTSPRLVNTGVYALQREFLEEEPVLIPGRGEYGLPQTLVKTARRFSLKVVPFEFWFPITVPEDLKAAERIFLGKESMR